MIQTHNGNDKNITGSINVNKCILADFSDLIRISPTSARVFVLLSAYSDEGNNIITDVKSISKVMGIESKVTKASLNFLLTNGYISLSEVTVDMSRKINGVVHDKELYKESGKREWNVIGTKLVADYRVNGTYNKIHINENILNSCGAKNSMLINIKNNLFFDTKINNDEIFWER